MPKKAPPAKRRPTTTRARTSSAAKTLRARRKAPLATPNDLNSTGKTDVAGALNEILADVFALYLKTKNFHWHASGPNFRSYHLLFDEQAGELFAMTDDIAERVRKVGGSTLRSIGHIAKLQRIADNDADFVTPLDMLAELLDDNRTLITGLRSAHDICDAAGDIATASLIENWVDEAEKRVWFLFESTRHAETPT